MSCILYHLVVVVGVNGCCVQEEKLPNEGIDELFLVAREFTERVGVRPSMWKADIDSAFRRVPLKASDRFALRFSQYLCTPPSM